STKVFEQSAGFLRIPSGKFVLDATGIHPERYQAVRDMAQDLNVSLSDLIGEGAKKIVAHRSKWASLIGEFTFDDIVKELEKPGRDPRDPFKVFKYRDDIFEVKDLTEGMICPGIVTNVTNFGAFVDLGVHQDGLVHISELSHKFVDDPRKAVSPGQQVNVKVLKVDQAKNQISLTMKLETAPQAEAKLPRNRAQSQSPQSRPPGVHTRGHGGVGHQGPRSQQPQHQRNSHPQQPSSRPSRPAANPFNNPFAALLNNNQNKK
ncbi:MAG: S1 RNA-binding domain-containing protein, partial [Bdellovibrionales bacterium]